MGRLLEAHPATANGFQQGQAMTTNEVAVAGRQKDVAGLAFDGQPEQTGGAGHENAPGREQADRRVVGEA